LVDEIRNKKKQGLRVTTMDERAIAYNTDRKGDILNTYIFKSMANLIYFFEFINNNPQLIDKFESDIEDLLGLKPQTNPGNSAFIRLVRAIIGEGQFSDFGNSKFNFRYRLLKLIQFQINQKAMQYYANPHNPEYQKDRRFKDKVWNELVQAELWMKLLDTFKANETKEQKRIIDV